MPLMTANEFENLLQKPFGQKKQELLEIEAEISKYHEMSVEWDVTEKYNQLNTIYTLAESYMEKYPDSGRNSQIRNVFVPNLTETVAELIPEETVVDKKLHFVWVGGKLTDIAKQYIGVWKMVNEDYTSTIWFDSRVLLANTLKKAIFRKCDQDTVLANEEGIQNQTYTHNEFVRDSANGIYEERKKFFSLYETKKEETSIHEIIKEFLTSEEYGYGMDADELQTTYEDALAQMTELEARDFSESDLLTANGLEPLYLREVLNYQNLAAASDMVRVAALNAEGGYYLDVDMLPAVNSSIFDMVEIDMNYDDGKWQQLYLESIMKYSPDLIPGYTTETLDELPDIITEDIQLAVEGKAVTELFLPLGDLSTSPLVMKICINNTGLGNNALLSHPNSMMGKIMIQNMIKNYAILDEYLSENIKPEQTYTQARAQLNAFYMEKRNEAGALTPEMEYLENILSYISVGLEIDAGATIQLTGPGNVMKTICSFFFKTEWEESPSTDRLTDMVKIGDNKVSIHTEEDRKSAWILRKGAADSRFKDVKQNLIESALDYDDALNFDEWAMPEPEELLDRIGKNNWVSAKPNHGRVIVQMQGDSISKEAASNLFSKYADRAVYIVLKPDGITSYSYLSESNEVSVQEGYVFPDSLLEKQSITMTVLGHGSGTQYGRKFALKTAHELVNTISEILGEVNSTSETPVELSVNLLGCRMYSTSEEGGSSYPEQVVYDLYKRLADRESINRSLLRVSANEFDVRINEAGKKEILDYSGQWVVKEQVLLRDQLGKHYFTYNETSQKTQRLSNDSSVLTIVLNDAYKELLDPELGDELKLEILDGFIVGSKELKKALITDAKPAEGSQTDQRVKKLLQGIDLTETLSSELYKIFKEKGFSENEEHYYFDLSSVESDETTGLYNMRIFNLDTGEIVTHTFSNPIFFQYKNMLDEEIQQFKEGVELVTDSHIGRNMELDDVQNANTLNAAFFLQSLLDFKSQYNNIHNLNKTLRVQIYTQLFRSGVGTLQTAADVLKITADAAGTEIKLLNGMSQGLSVTAMILDGIIMTSLIIELTNTSNQAKRASLETQIGIMSVNVALNAGSITASLMGASAAASALSYIAVPIAGIAVGLPSLIENLYVLRESYLESIKYFGYLWQVQKIFFNDETKKISIPADDIVITEIDFKKRKYTLGKFLLRSMTSGSGHIESEVDSFFAAPNPDKYGELLSVYEAINFVADNTFPEQELVVLPASLNRRLDYEMSPLASADVSLDPDDHSIGFGLQILNNIKQYYAGKFYWRFYAPPGDWGITKLAPVYLPTNIDVRLDHQNKTLIIPHNSIPEALRSLRYTLWGGGGRYVVIVPPENLDVQFELTKGDVFTINVNYFVHTTTTDEDGSLILQEEFLEEIPPLGITAAGGTKRVQIGTGDLTFRGDLTQHVYLHYMIAGEQVQMLIDVDLETDHISAALSGTIEEIIANKDQIINAVKALGIQETISSSIQLASSGKINGCVAVKEEQLIIAAVHTEGETKKIYTWFSGSDVSDPTNYMYSMEAEREVTVQIKEETVLVNSEFTYEQELIEYMLQVDAAYHKEIRSLRLKEKATESLMSSLRSAEDKKEALALWLFDTLLSHYIPGFAIWEKFVMSCTDKYHRYLEYILETRDDIHILTSYYGSWKSSQTQFTIFNNGSAHLIASKINSEDMYGNVSRSFYINSNITENLFIDDIIILPDNNTLYTTIEPLNPDNSLPAVNIAAWNERSEFYNITIRAGRDNFVWTRRDNDLIIFNNVDDPSRSTVRICIIEAFEAEHVKWDTQRIAFNESGSNKTFWYSLSRFITSFGYIPTSMK